MRNLFRIGKLRLQIVRLLRQLLIHQRSGAGFEANQRHSCSKTAVSLQQSDACEYPFSVEH